jgi:phage gpG-like protein
MLRFTFEVENAKKIDLAFGGLVAKIQDWRSLWPHVIERVVKSEERLYSSEGVTGGHGQWAPLTEAYEKAKRRKYGEKPIEQASERLRQSIVEAGEGHVEDLQPLSMTFGTDVPYAIYQQTGTRKMPARRLFDFTQEDQRVIQQEIQRQAVQYARTLGFRIASQIYGETVSAVEARALGVQALEGGPGADLISGM